MTDAVPDYDVVINGFGPVGEVLANLLGQAGHRVAVFERAASVYHMPRAAHFDHEIMRVFQSIGLAEAILPSTSGIRGMHFLNAEGAKLFGFDQPEGPTAHGWTTDYMFYQPMLETALREGVARYPKVDVFLEHEVIQITDDGEVASVTVRTVDSAATERIVRARYVVGCDGARSVTRRFVGIELEDVAFNESWLVIDAKLTAPVDLPDVCHQICDPARPTTYVPMPEPYRRWEFMLLPGETVEQMEEHGRVLELLEPWVAADEVEIVRAVVYTFHAVLARGWRQGRVLIAGDAAHQMPPFLGQGMCSGIRDAANLAWKLDLVMGGLAATDLLDTYEPERSPHVRRIIDAAVAFGGIICTTDPEVAAARDEQFLANPDALAGGADALAPALGPGLIATDGDHAGVGRLFIQPWVSVTPGTDVLLDDALGGDGGGPRFVLLAHGADPAADLDPATAKRFQALGGVLAIVDDPNDPGDGVAAPTSSDVGTLRLVDRDGYLTEWFERHEAGCVLLRPDRYVFDTGSSPAGAGALIGELVRTLQD